MKTKMVLEILLIIIAVLALGYIGFHYAGILLAPTVQQNQVNSVCFGQNCFQVELAVTEAQRERGLMYRNELDKNKGMLFIFDKEDIYSFWMKNTLIPLDMVWIDSNSNVVFIGQNIQPCKSLICPSIIPLSKAKYVLEINAGLCEEIGLKVGDLVQISPGLQPV